MDNIILSIKPKFVEKIFEGSKKVEIRKQFTKNISTIFIYESFPTKMITGKFTIKNILEDSPISIWNLTEKINGISEKDFFEYSKNKEKIYAIFINELKIFETPINPYKEFQNFKAPQNYMYCKNLKKI